MSDTAQQPGAAKKVGELVKGDRVHMYGTVVEILGPWFVPDDTEFLSGWGRLPMNWDGLECAPPERKDTEVTVAGDDTGA